MTDKYCDPSLVTGSNDGTSVANAWQDLEEVLLNTMGSGSYAAGDTIYVRSHDGTSDILVTISTGNVDQVEIGTRSSPVKFAIDDGTKWADGGTLTIKKTDDNTFLSFADHTVWEGIGLNIRFLSETASHARGFDIPISEIEGIVFNNVIFESNPDASDIGNILTIGIRSNVIFSQCKFIAGNNYTSFHNNIGITITDRSYIQFNGCIFDYSGLGPGVSGDSSHMIYVGGYSTEVHIIGGYTVNGTSSYEFLHAIFNYFGSVQGANVYINGFNYGPVQPAYKALLDSFAAASETAITSTVTEENVNNGSDFSYTDCWGHILWDSDGNFPVLTATLPSGPTDKWSMQVIPSNAVSPLSPVKLLPINKFWNATAATVDIRLELLIKDTSVVGGSDKYNSPQKDEWWVGVSYINDSTSLPVFETSKTSGALATSTASWSSTSYGAQSYNKHKIELTTANSVKEDTIVVVVLYSSKSTDDTTDFYFVDPDVVLE